MTPEQSLDRERWEQAALDALERGGLAAVAVEPLARALGVTKGSFYWHFRNRQELLAATVARWERLHVDGPLAAVATIADPRERLLELIGKAGAKPPSIFIRLLDAVDEPTVAAAVARAAEERVAFMATAFRELGLPRARARRQALLAYSAYVGRAHLARDAPEVLGDPAALSRHIAQQLIGWVRHHAPLMTQAAPTLAQRLLDGDRRALARAITLVESDDPAGWELVSEVYPHTGQAAIVGLTGAPGAGKSTLIGALTKLRRAQDRTVAVLSIDPSSPFTQGALLGDRIRLTEHFLDPGVFIRSMANRGALGGLSEAALQTALLMDASGKDDVLLETVGVGQAEVDIIDHADTIVLVLMPGSGDSIQALKAGVMEIPDIIVVNKADHPLTETMVREIRGVLSLAPQRGWRVPIIKTEAHKGTGVEELVVKLDEHRAYIEQEGTLSLRRQRNLRSEVVAICTFRLRRRLEEQLDADASFASLLDEVVGRRVDPATAASRILERLDAAAASRPE